MIGWLKLVAGPMVPMMASAMTHRLGRQSRQNSRGRDDERGQHFR